MGVTGSVAAYKACLVLRLLQKAGAEVRVVMTDAAQQFVGKPTFEALTQSQVITEMFPQHRVMSTEHIHLAEWADAILICPASANTIGKVASGIADNFLTTLIMASRAPVFFAPAMDFQMVTNTIYKQKCRLLIESGYHFIDTELGELASGFRGEGRLAAPEKIIDAVSQLLSVNSVLQGRRILITAGPTREYLDAMRYISNPSTGEMGTALAQEALVRGAAVSMICGPMTAAPPDSVEVAHVESAHEMADSVKKHWQMNDILIMTAAVADFTPKERIREKYKKNNSDWIIQLTRTPDILEQAAQNNAGRLVVGFALESRQGLENAKLKMEKKKLDLICLNMLDSEKSVFGPGETQITMIDRSGAIDSLPPMHKSAVAKKILDKIENLISCRK